MKTDASRNEVKVFSSPLFGDIRVSKDEDGNPIFCLADVCRALELTNSRMVKDRLNQKGVSTVYTLTSRGEQPMNYVSEGNLYKCVFQSRKPNAETFQDWVCEDVLPSIRKTGGYIVSNDSETDEEIMARALNVANSVLAKREEKIYCLV